MSEEELLRHISEIAVKDFFLITEISKKGLGTPENIELFIKKKLQQIKEGSISRKFTYKDEAGWRLILTFYPTNEIVCEKYALKNKVSMSKYSK